MASQNYIRSYIAAVTNANMSIQAGDVESMYKFEESAKIWLVLIKNFMSELPSEYTIPHNTSDSSYSFRSDYIATTGITEVSTLLDWFVPLISKLRMLLEDNSIQEIKELLTMASMDVAVFWKVYLLSLQDAIGEI